MSAVIVYRDTLLPKSETEFMRRQYLGFQALRPVWVGRRVEPTLDPRLFPLGPVFTGASGAVFKLAGIIPQLPALRALNASVVHAQFGRGGAFALPLAERLQLPLVVTLHGGDVSKSAHYRRFPIPALLGMRMRRLIAYSTAFICVSEGVRSRAIARGFPSQKLVLLPIGVEIPATPPPRHTATGLLFIGRFVEMKGVPVLIEAIRLLRARGITQKITLIGDGPDRPHIEAALAGIEGVELRGWQTPFQVQQALAGAIALCLPSIVARSGETEGLPSVAMEAMAMGVPVIASSDASVEGLVVDGECGLIFPSRNAEALAVAMATLLDDPARTARLGQAAQSRVRAGFDATLQSRKLEALLQDAARTFSDVSARPSSMARYLTDPAGEMGGDAAD
jgi:glycosyltransferase involved in cell wall biosynthesis